MTLNDCLKMLVEKGGSDLHIASGSPPLMRLQSILAPLVQDKLNHTDTEEMVYSILTQEQRRRFEEEWELDFSFGISGVGRFRGNLHRQRGTVAATFRHLPDKIPTFQDIGLPQGLIQSGLMKKRHGLVLVTGSTGSGKSTTLASIIDYINSEREGHIIILEDPIEFIHKNKKSLIKQREVGSDTKSFAKGLHYVFRQDPDVILVGEMRDLETISGAIMAAETGRLVLATLHTSDAASSVERIVDAFPAYQQAQARSQVSAVLEGAICQQLLPRIGGGGRVAAFEVMIATPSIRNLIRQAKTHQIYSDIETGARFGMQSMNQALFELCQKKLVAPAEALARSQDPKVMQSRLAAAGLMKPAAAQE